MKRMTIFQDIRTSTAICDAKLIESNKISWLNVSKRWMMSQMKKRVAVERKRLPVPNYQQHKPRKAKSHGEARV